MPTQGVHTRARYSEDVGNVLGCQKPPHLIGAVFGFRCGVGRIVLGRAMCAQVVIDSYCNKSAFIDAKPRALFDESRPNSAAKRDLELFFFHFARVSSFDHTDPRIRTQTLFCVHLYAYPVLAPCGAHWCTCQGVLGVLCGHFSDCQNCWAPSKFPACKPSPRNDCERFVPAFSRRTNCRTCDLQHLSCLLLFFP